MAIQKNIGKNTIGDNNKMSVSLHEYNMSTHDLSTIEKNMPKESKPKTGESRGMKPQDKTGSYGEKRKPGDYLK